MNRLPEWLNGRLRTPSETSGEAADSGLLHGQACYTTARVCAGNALYAEHHVARLARDSRALGFDPPDGRLVLTAFAELSTAAFGRESGIVRLQASCDAHGTTRLLGTARPLGHDAAQWHAFVFSHPHPGRGPWPGVKRTGDPHLAAARAALSLRGLDEAILVDRDGYVIEGARSSFVFQNARGERITPDPARGGVRSIARELVCKAIPEVRQRNVSVAALFDAKELVAVNAVRGARPIQTLNGRPVGDPSGGALASEIARALATD